jgi:glutathione S-transferase
MKLYVYPFAPNPRKVLVYLKEKGVDVPLVQLDITKGENRTPDFLRKNPLGGLPVLELDDGTILTESLAIIEYFEETHPEKSMIGSGALERARVRELERICELGVMGGVATVFQNTSPFFAGRVKQSPEAAETGRMRIANALKVLDARIGDRPFVAGDRPTIADCTLIAALDFGQFAGVPLDPQLANVMRWYTAFKQRPSAAG